MKKCATKNQGINVNIELYKQLKEKRRLYLKSHYSGLNLKKSYTKNKPYFILTSGKQYNYEERNKSFGQCIDYFRVLSEVGKYHKKYENAFKMSKDEYIERLINHKINRWERRHPCPVNKFDIFYEEYFNNWKSDREKAIARIKEIVSFDNDKYYLYARYEKSDGGYTKWGTIVLAKLSGKYNVLLRAKKITDAEKEKHPSLVATNLINISTKKGRIILPLSNNRMAA